MAPEAEIHATGSSKRLVRQAAPLLPLANVGRADSFPNGPFRIIVPFGPGSATDQSARTVADGLNRIFGVPAVVENRRPAAPKDESGSKTRQLAPQASAGQSPYAPTRNGQRFLVRGGGVLGSTGLAVVQNWAADLKR